MPCFWALGTQHITVYSTDAASSVACTRWNKACISHKEEDWCKIASVVWKLETMPWEDTSYISLVMTCIDMSKDQISKSICKIALLEYDVYLPQAWFVYYNITQQTGEYDLCLVSLRSILSVFWTLGSASPFTIALSLLLINGLVHGVYLGK